MASIATGPNGLGIVAYFDGGPDNDLKVTVCGNAGCSGNTVTTVDDSPDGVGNGGWASITIGRDGLALISYMANQTGNGSDLRVAHCVNTHCTAVTTATADTGGFLGWYHTAIAIGGDGLGVVVYYDNTNHDLRVAHCADIACTGLTHTVVDEFDDEGQYPSITTGADGLPLIAYDGDSVLKVAHCGDVACATPLVVPF
jgi:hypothetical protein